MKNDRGDGDVTRPSNWISGRRQLLRFGFGLMLALLAFSIFQAQRIQSSLSQEAVQIYHAHVRQDDLITRLRRTLWLGANVTRDLLVHPTPEVELRFHTELNELRSESRHLLRMINELPEPVPDDEQLRRRTEEFWSILDRAPKLARAMTPAARYDFIQREIVPRRNGVGELVREFTKLSEQALQESEREFAKTRRAFAKRLLLVLGVCLLFGAGVAIFSVAHAETLERRNVEQYEQVQRVNTELQQLSGRLMEVQEEERIHLARELHDEIGQMVATVRMEISQAEALPESRFHDVRLRLTRAKDLAGQTVRAVRDICLWLRPTMLDDLGLVPALQWQVEQFESRTSVRVVFLEDGVAEDLPERTKTCVYRVLQEALHNIEKHAKATAVQVSVRGREGQLVLDVKDNGCGFAMDSGSVGRKGGCGILGMRERALATGGKLEIDSSAGAGTRVLLSVPAPVSMRAAEGLERVS